MKKGGFHLPVCLHIKPVICFAGLVVAVAIEPVFLFFRHSAGTLLYEKSRDLKLVQGTLRHSDISTTSDIYVHLGDTVLREGTRILTEEILLTCDLFVTQKSEMVSQIL